MAVVLVTGMSAVGKSSVLAELGRRGHRVVDTDDDGWIHDGMLPDGTGPEPLWREDRITALLDEHTTGSLFVGGCVANQAAFYSRFDAVVLLSVPVDVLVARLDTRDTNRFGKSPAERSKVIDDVATVEPLLRPGATAEIDTRRPLRDVADELEAIAARPPGSPPAPAGRRPSGEVAADRHTRRWRGRSTSS